MVNGNSEEEVKDTAATDAEPEAEVVDAEIVEEADSPETSGVKLRRSICRSCCCESKRRKQLNGRANTSRLHAEWDTYRRRMKEQREEESRRATEKLVEDIIPVLDDFERSINYANENGEEGLLGGVTAVYAKLNEVLVKEGVEVIDPVGQPYEALEAQAVATVDNPNVPDETVEQVYQKGYRMGNKDHRPAMVTVAVGGPKRETDEEEDNE